MNLNNPLASSFPRRRESSEKTSRVADKTKALSATRIYLIFWIPACAGMTLFFGLMDNPG